MSYEYDQFVSTFSKGSARTNRFKAFILTPNALKADGQTLRDLNLRLESVSFPGKNIRTTTDENVYGPSYEVAQGISYAEDISMTFLLRPNHEERWVFNDWQDLIVDPTTYNLNYYNEYTSSMYVYQLDEANRYTAGILIRDVFPKTVNAVEFSNTSQNEIARATINMAFRDWAPLQVQQPGDVSATWVRTEDGPIPRGTVAIGNQPTQVYSGYEPKTVRQRGITEGFPDGINDGIRTIKKGINEGLRQRDRAVFAINKVMAFKNFFKGITKSTNPLGNLGIGGFGGF